MIRWVLIAVVLALGGAGCSDQHEKFERALNGQIRADYRDHSQAQKASGADSKKF